MSTTIRDAVVTAMKSASFVAGRPEGSPPREIGLSDRACGTYADAILAALEAEGFVVVPMEPPVGQTEIAACWCGRVTGKLTGRPGDPPFKGLALVCGPNCRPTDPGVAAMREGEL